jgi:hypothetical protein
MSAADAGWRAIWNLFEANSLAEQAVGFRCLRVDIGR